MSHPDRGPWKIKSVRAIYDNPWIKVDEYQVISPTGNPGIYGLVSFKNLAIAVLPIADNGDTWLVGQYRFTTDSYSWEIPMGGGALTDTPEESALRELREETGLTASRLTMLGEFDLSNSVTTEKGYAFLATELQQGETEFDDTEQLDIKRVPFDEALAMTMDGRITDLLSIVTIQKARLLGLA
ncbi:MAG: DNA mismatch repair protein MutT [Oceanospirillaceae bacterium]|nr:DNA mismatch repair protein MutT [Oceanospirillaceae bacterium]|tara:strand:- start:458 stop:1009 length:552 start_codon:yes stop_codon:yes gene_type:complete